MFKLFLSKKQEATVFNKLNPSSFFILYVFLSFSALFSGHILLDVFMLVLSIIFLAIANVPFRFLKFFIIIGIWFAGFLWIIILLTGLYGGYTLYSFKILGILVKISYGNFYVGLGTFLRVLALTFFTTLFIFVTDPRSIVEALKGLKFPYSVSLSLALIFRNFAIFSNDYEIIIQAQKSRGLDVNKGNIIRRLNKMLGIIIPLVYLSLKRADDLVNALETKSYDPKSPRSSFYEYNFYKKDYLTIALSIALFILTMLLNFMQLPLLNLIGVI